MDYYALEPWGFPAEDTRMGMLTASVLRAAGAKVKASDFMLAQAEPEKPVSVVDRLKAVLGVRD